MAAPELRLGMTPQRFLRDYWQKRPLLVRQALPGFGGIIDRDALLQLATRGDAVSRLVIEHPRRRGAGHWERHHGPFGALDASLLPRSHWTLLVHGLESLVAGGWELLRQFSFIPAARIDDLMVSFAADGGGVGPHEDDYDVFLLQGAGRRRWRISTHSDHVTDRRAAIKILANFSADPESDWVLDPGDLLYLPPSVAHWGVAEGDCFTYSIGFLAPSERELLDGFAGYLAQTLSQKFSPRVLLADPNLQTQREPLAVSDALVGQVTRVLSGVRWDQSLMARFVGCFLTRPKPHVQFAPRTIAPAAFAKRLGRRGRLQLALPSRGLIRGRELFFNSEAHVADAAMRRWFTELVRERSLKLPRQFTDDEIELLHGWAEAGYLV